MALSEPGHAEGEELFVLMIGDAMTQFVLEDLNGFSEASPDWDLAVQFSDTSSFDSLLASWQLEESPTREALSAGRWDIVVLQETSLLPGIAGLRNHPGWYADGVVPESTHAQGEPFWQSSEQLGGEILVSTSARLALFPIWPRAEGHEDLVAYFPDARSATMAVSTSEALQDWLDAVDELSEQPDRLSFSSMNAIWFHTRDQLGFDLYSEDPVLAGPTGHYLTAASLFRSLTGASMTELNYNGELDSLVAEEIRATVDTMLGEAFALPERIETDKEEEEPPVDDVPDEMPEPEPALPPSQTYRLLLVGDGHTQTLSNHLQGFFDNDPTVNVDFVEASDETVIIDHVLYLPSVLQTASAALDSDSAIALVDGQAAIDLYAVAAGPQVSVLTPWPLGPDDPILLEIDGDQSALTQQGIDRLLEKALPSARQGWFDAPRPPAPSISPDTLQSINFADLWQQAEATLPELNFYGDDLEVDPTPGEYSAAASIFAHVTQRSVIENLYQSMLTEEQSLALRELTLPSSEEPKFEAPNKVLMLGNSTNGLLADDLLGFLGGDAQIEVLDGDLEDLYSNVNTRANMVTTPWDTIILQGSMIGAAYAAMHAQAELLFEGDAPFDLSTSGLRFRVYGELLARHALVSTDANVLLVTSWPYQDGQASLANFPPEANAAQMQAYTNEGYENLAGILDREFPGRVSVAHVGDAWQRETTVDLYGEDPVAGHVYGHYLAAAVLFESISQQSAADRPYLGNLPEDIAVYLRSAADPSSDGASRLVDRSTLQFVSPLVAEEEASLAEHLNANLDAIAPENTDGTFPSLFGRYDKVEQSTWADNWTKLLDFSGVAWDQPQSGTLITDRFLLLARHFTRPNGSEVKFTDRNGDLVVRTLIAQKFARFDSFDLRTDITVALLDKPVPETVAIYPLLSSAIHPDDLIGAKLLSTYKDKTVAISAISRFDLFGNDSEVVTTSADPELVDPSWDRSAVRGDSGHPSFLILDGRLVLFSGHTFTGSGTKGPFYGGLGNHAKIQALMEQLQATEIGS